MDVQIMVYTGRYDKKCSQCNKKIPAGDNMLNVVLNDYTNDEDEHCNIEHDVYICHACAKDVFLDGEVIPFLIRGPI